MVYTKVVAINTVYNFELKSFLLISLFRVLNMRFTFIDFEIQILQLHGIERTKKEHRANMQALHVSTTSAYGHGPKHICTSSKTRT